MSPFRKLRSNLLSERAISVLGPRLYGTYLSNFLTRIPAIVKVGDLRPLDMPMGIVAKRFCYRGSTFCFDCQFCDEHLNEDSFAFGIAREIYIRDCYFKWHLPGTFDSAQTVVDLGANRGAFSALMTTRAKFILSVECSEQYAPIIRHNMFINNYATYAVETAFVGDGGSVIALHTPKLTIDALFHRHNLEFVDLIKIDIEGSEFSLFGSAGWLRRVGAISMEVHPRYGDPSTMLTSLRQHGFTYVIANENLDRVSEAAQASFVYAWRSNQ